VPTSAGFVGTNASKQIVASAYTPENPANKDAASGYAGLDASTHLKTAEFPAFTGDITTTAGGVVTVLGNIPTGVTRAGTTIDTEIAAPSTPTSGKVTEWADSTDHRFHDKNSSGVIGTTVVAATAGTHQFATAISAAGVLAFGQPSAADLSVGALANGITATTQAASDNSTNVATTAYADAECASNTTSGDGGIHKLGY
jgi:hypothetical protein